MYTDGQINVFQTNEYPFKGKHSTRNNNVKYQSLVRGHPVCIREQKQTLLQLKFHSGRFIGAFEFLNSLRTELADIPKY